MAKCEWWTCKDDARPGKKMCFQHGRIYENTMSTPAATTTIPAQSDKRKIDHKEYKKIVSQMLKENPLCEIKKEGCGIVASGLHHKQKRTPANYLDRNNLIRACSNCNLYVELHPLEAMQEGLTISKFK